MLKQKEDISLSPKTIVSVISTHKTLRLILPAIIGFLFSIAFWVMTEVGNSVNNGLIVASLFFVSRMALGKKISKT